MPTYIQVAIYNMDEARRELASRVGRPRPYSRQRIYELVSQYLRTAGHPQGSFWLTDDQLWLLARSIKPVGRPKNGD